MSRQKNEEHPRVSTADCDWALRWLRAYRGDEVIIKHHHLIALYEDVKMHRFDLSRARVQLAELQARVAALEEENERLRAKIDLWYPLPQSSEGWTWTGGTDYKFKRD